MPELSELFDLIGFDTRSHSVAEAGLELRTILLCLSRPMRMTASKLGPTRKARKQFCSSFMSAAVTK